MALVIAITQECRSILHGTHEVDPDPSSFQITHQWCSVAATLNPSGTLDHTESNGVSEG
ncbi:hypothetical protein OCOJLMKI_4841 [Methylobacterium iners]|uniref:Uncharacterized protein n=1 Tax=Methylobacterium iners TaxID=418707 RepID=A0ABQ4S733_9HYPH|nr:hypothetical protein OCOJLMKI_4841 [Methylobacterium iners]